ncbi:MAG: hypothetical protein MJ211_08545 [Bacteroidales bacterium]|nr:hypothetical protein [Bacteroidales bacterium]
MKKTLTIFALLICIAISQTSFAQNTVESIRSDYSAIKNTIKEMGNGEEMPLLRYEIIKNQNLPGTGPHKEVVQFYFSENENDYGEIESRLIKYASVKYNFAAREFYEEYLYDKNGKIEFIYAKNPDGPDFETFEFRFYINAGKIVKVIINCKKENETKFSQIYSGATLDAKYKTYYDNFIKQADKNIKMFNAIDY